MPIFEIEGPADPRLAPYRNLKSGHHTPDSFIVESQRLVERLLLSSFHKHSILTTEKRIRHLQEHLPPDLPVYVGSQATLSEIAGFNLHRGCLAHAGAPSTKMADHLKRGVGGVTVLLEGLADPANVGSIIRNAAAFGASLVVVDPKGASPFSRKAARASAGHIFRTPIAIANIHDAIGALRVEARDVDIVVTTGRKDALPLEDLPPAERRALVIGNEGHGVSDEVRNIANSCRTIPLSDEVDSLNAAAASALALYVLRQKATAPNRST